MLHVQRLYVAHRFQPSIPERLAQFTTEPADILDWNTSKCLPDVSFWHYSLPVWLVVGASYLRYRLVVRDSGRSCVAKFIKNGLAYLKRDSIGQPHLLVFLSKGHNHIYTIYTLASM